MAVRTRAAWAICWAWACAFGAAGGGGRAGGAPPPAEAAADAAWTPGAYLAVVGILGVIAAIATVVPAVRGAREECGRLLRSE